MKKRGFWNILKVLVILGLILVIALLGVNFYVRGSTKARIITAEQAAADGDFDCILVLGCQVRADGSPSLMLRDRLDRGLELYGAGAAPKLLVSGDHGQTEYDEVNTMKRYVLDAGVDSRDVFMDHAGFSTYDSVYRARDVFRAKRVLIVTQEYHLYRALFIARALGLEAWGVSAAGGSYGGQTFRELREIAARVKDAVKCVFRPAPTFLGEPLPVSGDGNATNDN